MNSLSEHASVLSDALFAIYEVNELDDIYSYLKIASGVVSVNFETPGTSAPSLCGLAGLDALSSELSGNLAASWSRFSAVWSALQAYDDYWAKGIIPDPTELQNPPHERLRQLSTTSAQDLKEPPQNAGQIERICYKISQAYRHPVPEKYEQCLQAFKDLVDASGVTYSQSLPAHVLLSGEGLYRVNEIRHALAQWDTLYIDIEEHPELENDPAHHPHVMMIETATRLVLLTIQMMTLCIFPLGTQLQTHHFTGFEELDQVGIDDAMINLHLEDFSDRMEDTVNRGS